MKAPKLVVVGHCTSTTARILCCTDTGARLARLAWRAGPASGCVEVELVPAPPYEIGVFELRDLPPGAEIAYGIAAGERADPNSMPTHRFRLLPPHRPLRVALVSCNGAFEVPDASRRYDLWRALRRQIDEGNVDLIVHAGDQVYADEVVKRYRRRVRKELDGALPEVTQAYRRLYAEEFWTVPEVAAVLTSCPSIMTWDDHDIDEGWGSNPFDDQPWRRVFFRAARQAFSEFQASIGCPRMDPDSFACGFIHGEVAFLLLDGRTHRLYKDGRVLGEPQLEAARRWLEALPLSTRRVYLVLGIPPIHAKLATAAAILRWTPLSEPYASDLRDGWASRKNREECARLMKVLTGFCDSHPSTDITILSGDVHVANIGRFDRDGRVVMWQVTSSGIGSPPPQGAAGWLMENVSRNPVDLGAGVCGHLMPIMPDGHDLMTRRNFALLRVDEHHALRVALVGEGLPQPLTYTLPSRSPLP